MAAGSGFRIADAYVAVTLDKSQLRDDLAKLPSDLGSDAERAGNDTGKRLGKGVSDGADAKTVGKKVAADVGDAAAPEAEKQGRKTGDKMSQGMQKGLLTANPLVTAAIAGGLIAGAPVLAAAATTLFAGIAVAAVHNNADIQASFESLKSTVAGTFTSAASVTIPMFVTAMGRISQAVSALGPQFKTAFSALGPAISSLTTGVINLMQNAMPGLVSVMKASGPVFQGLASLMGSIGTGLSQLFQIISEHASAAGTVFSSLGSIIGSLLPILGQLVGVGADLASAILPPLAVVLHGVASALNLLAPVLPIVAAGFLAFKAISSVTSLMELFGAKLQTIAADGNAFSTALAGNAASGVSKLTSVMGPLVAVITTVGTLWSESQHEISDWSNALLEGGRSAATATQQLQDAHSRSILDAHSLSDAWSIVKGAFADGAAQLEGYDSAQAKASAGTRALLAAMDPVSRAQALQTQALNNLNYALEKHGEGSASAETAERKYKDASDAVTEAQGRQEQAIHGVTQAMLDQADQAMASIDSTFALQHAQNQQRDAETALADAIKQHGTASIEAHDAQQSYIESIYGTAQAAAKLTADQSGLKQGTEEYKNVLDTQLLKSLQSVEGTLSGPAKDAVDGFITTLQSAGVTTDGLGKSADTTGKKLDNLGTKNPKPTIGPAADNVTPQVDNLMNSLFDLGNARPVPKADLDISPANRNKDVMVGMLDNLGIQHPTPTANINSAPFNYTLTGLQGALNGLNGWRVYPWATLMASTSGAEGALNYAARNRVSYVTQLITTKIGSGSYAAATGGSVGRIVGRRFDVGGKIRGPGGPTQDLVQAITNTGEPLRVSNDEWVIKGSSSRKYGDRAMAAINAGTASVSAPGLGTVPGSGAASGGNTYQVTMQIQGVWDLTNPQQVRSLTTVVRDNLVRLEREQR